MQKYSQRRRRRHRDEAVKSLLHILVEASEGKVAGLLKLRSRPERLRGGGGS